jgi:hypothetical protein
MAWIGATVLNGCAVILTATLMFMALETPDATARLGTPPTVVVNRALKKDRLAPVKQWLRSDHLRVFDTRLDDGCESLVSPLTHSPLAQIAGRCLS